ncbi:MAG: toprim domain-containing protein [Kiritimatiellae bacterium]|jgi:topoisomerase-4 subunit B|nr:toprim domain-containing protein [Kiritimatiellia bacterium]
MAKKEVQYNEDTVKSLSSLEHIRLRSGMYIGRTGSGAQYEDGIYILLKEVIDNSIDEFIMGNGKEVKITVKDDEVTVRDYGRGIPLGKVVECVSKINTGAKYNDDVFQFSVGLNGVGTKAVNALSSHFVVKSYREDEYVEAYFEQGKLISQNRAKQETNVRNGTFMSFTPDPEIFKKYAFEMGHIERRMRFYAYLNAGLKLVFNGEVYKSEDGLLELIRDESAYQQLYQPIYFKDETLEIAFTHTHQFSEEYYSFVNGQFTVDGGTHLSAFREGILKGINEFSGKKFGGDDVREGLLGAIAIRLKEPIFESQTKNRLGNTEIRSELVSKIKDIVVDSLHRNKKDAASLLAKIEENQKCRQELQSVKKLARERSKAVSIRIPQLKDCKLHLNAKRNFSDKSMIFITEGQSAAGSMTSCRNPNTQAIFMLKGKPLNVNDLPRSAIYKNVELYNLMCSLNIEETIEELRYQNVVLATDADVDGLHIRNLLITFFLRFFKEIVIRGHLKILETPLFRVRNKQETIYCYSEAERDAALKKIVKGVEVTRFKGLGEISPKEFKDFISEDNIKLTSVDATGETAITELLDFYSGKNTPERKAYIMDNLILPEDI